MILKMSKHNFNILTRKQSSNIEGQTPARQTVPIKVCLGDIVSEDFPAASFTRVCETCGNDHSFRPTFEDVKTSIEIIPVLIEELLKREQLEQEGIVA
jgi:hypothetical protein